MTRLWSVGLDFHSADLELRAKAASKELSLYDRLHDGLLESVWVSTCNRVEIFGVGARSAEECLGRWLEVALLSPSSAAYFKTYDDEECLRHLFRVTASLESMVVGETQITSQVKRAYDDAARMGRSGTILNRSFQRAFKVAKRIRSQTEVGRLAVSIPSVGVKLAEKVLGSLSGINVGIIGLGEIGRVAAEHFSTVQPKSLYLYNRTTSVAEELKAALALEPSAVQIGESVHELAQHCQVIVNAVDVPLVDAKAIEVIKGRDGPILILDLAVPPQIELFDMSSHYVYRVDDLKRIADENNKLRVQEVEKAEGIIREEAAGCWSSLQTLDVGEILKQVQGRARSIKAKELEELKSRLPELSPTHWAEIEKMAERLTSKVLQDPMVGLRSSLQESSETETLVQFFRSIFRI